MNDKSRAEKCFQSFALITILLTGNVASERAPLRLLAAARMPKAPKIDGKLDDPCWRVPITARFTCVLYRKGRAEAQTQVRAGYDDTHLYVAIRCDEPRMIEAVKVIGAGAEVYGESVEVFIDANLDRGTYQQYRVAIDGQTELRVGFGVAQAKVPWRAAVNREAYAWAAEIAIPWKLIGDAPESGGRLGFNVTRTRMNVRPVELSCWSNTQGGFHAPARFGDLVTGSYAIWLKKHALMRIVSLQKEIDEMLSEYPASTKNLRNKASALVTIIQDAERYPTVARNEDAALAVFELISREIARAETIHDQVRLAVINGEFR